MRRNPGHQSSEYQRQFEWKSSKAESPLLTAEQMWYSNNESIPPFKSNPVVMESEYKNSFKGSPPPRSLRLRRDVELNEVPPCQKHTASPNETIRKKERQTEISRKSSLNEQSVHPDTKQLQQEESRNHAPLKPARKMKTEYSSNFRSLNYSNRDGAWISSRAVGKEIQELRERADAYRKRAWGTHFSRHHLSQILSEQNHLWEASDCSSSSSFTNEDTRSPSSPIIEALDLARVNSVDRSHSSGASVSMKSEGNSGEDRGLSKMPTSSLRRKIAWDEENDFNEREKTDPNQKSKEVPQLKKTDNNEATIEFSKEINEVDTSSALKSGSSKEEGRLPTPKLKSMLVAQRTHHHRTTPSTGGAILVSPPKMKNTKTARRNEAPLGKVHTPYRHLSQVTPSITHSRNENTSHSSPPAGLPTVDPLPLEEVLLTEDSPTSLTTKPAKKPNKQVIQAWLRDCTPSHANRIQGTLRNAEFQHNGNLGLSRPDLFVPTSDDRSASDNDDKMSQISSWSAASCSMASQVLDRAQKRKKDFWGKT